MDEDEEYERLDQMRKNQPAQFKKLAAREIADALDELVVIGIIERWRRVDNPKADDELIEISHLIGARTPDTITLGQYGVAAFLIGANCVRSHIARELLVN